MTALRNGLCGTRATEATLVVLTFSAITLVYFYPLSLSPGSFVYRPDNGDGQFSIWNVAWVAHALIDDPRHLLDANIFFPHRRTLAYSELNLVAGAVAVPAYWLTRSAYAAHNTAVLVSFVLSATTMYYLCQYVVRDWRASVVGALCFAFAPHVVSHLLHIQLLMTAGLPLSLLAFHRLADRPSAARGVALGLALTFQTLACHYYVVFAVLIVGVATLVTAASRSLWTRHAFWGALVVAAAVAAVTSAPVLWLFVSLSQSGFERPLDQARQFAADWRAYLASAGLLHEWMLPLLGHWKEVLFPGFVAVGLGAAGVAIGWRQGGRARETVVLYSVLAVLAFWASFGPDAGLYRVLYEAIPGFSLMRAAARFGLVVLLALSVLAALGAGALLTRSGHPATLAAVLFVATAADSFIPLRFEPVPPTAPVYHVLATLPDGAVLEIPAYSRLAGFRRSKYMLDSTTHWKPLVNAYSDHTPDDFDQRLEIIGDFPTTDSLRDLARDKVRYAVIHLDTYPGDLLPSLHERLTTFAPYLQERYRDRETLLFEITGAPD